MKKVLALILSVFILLSVCGFTALADGKITVTVNGKELNSDVPAQAFPVYDQNGTYVGDRTMLPIRAISEELNCDVYWDAENEGVLIYRKDNLYMMWVGADTAFRMDGLSISKGYKMDVPPTIVDGRTLIPVRAVAEIMGAEVNWIEATKTVEIKYELGELEENTGLAELCAIYEQALRQNYTMYCDYVNGNANRVTGKMILEGGEEIAFELYPDLAPSTCYNFISLAKSGFYDGTIFHRVIKDFVAQGGGYDKNGEYKEAGVVYGEFLYNGFFNLIPHTRGALSLARAQDFNSGSSQFFIVHKDSNFLDGNYAAFGRVTEGMEVVDRICEAETDTSDKPVTDIVIKQVIINE